MRYRIGTVLSRSLWGFTLAAGACLMALALALWFEVIPPAGPRSLAPDLPTWAMVMLYAVLLVSGGLVLWLSMDAMEEPSRAALPASAAAVALAGIAAGLLIAPSTCTPASEPNRFSLDFPLGMGPFVTGMMPLWVWLARRKAARRVPASPHAAARAGNLALVERFVGEGTKPDARDEEGCTILHRAAEGGHPEVARFLLARGAGPDARTKEGETPLSLLASGDAVRSASAVEVAQLLLAHGADVSAEDSEGFTPLHAAASSDAYHLARLLLERGAKVTARARGDGDTPLHCAAFSRARRTAALLLAHGANANARLNTGESALDLAVEAGPRSLVRLLRPYGARGEAASHAAAGRRAHRAHDGADHGRGRDPGREA